MADVSEEEVDWEENDSQASEAGAADEANTDTAEARKKRRRTYSKDDRALALLAHKEDLLRRMRRASRLHRSIEDETLTVSLMSIAPGFLLRSARTSQADHARDVIAWFNMNFNVIPNCSVTAEEGRDGSSADGLLEAFALRAGSVHQLTQIFVALLRVCGFQTRYVCTVDPVGTHPRNLVRADDDSGEQEGVRVRPPDQPWAWAEALLSDAPSAPSAAPTSSSRKRDSGGSGPSHKRADRGVFASPDTVIDLVSDDEKTSSSSTSAPPAKAQRWIHVEFNKGLIDEPRCIEARMRRRVVYVLAFDCCDAVADVTARYANQYSTSAAERLPCSDPFLVNALRHWAIARSLSDGAVETIEGMDLPHTLAEEHEEQELARLRSDEPIPDTILALKGHARFVLERDLRKDEALHPLLKRPVGLVKGVKVFLREHVCVLRDKWQWKRALRVVRQGEEPHRTATRKRGDGTVAVALFGEWQTEPYWVPPIADDQLPVNAHGNMEVWGGDARLLPLGASLVTAPHALLCAKRLGVPFAPVRSPSHPLPCLPDHAQALFGFETSGMHKHPVIGGVVVLSRDADLVQAAAREVSVDKEDRLEARRLAAVLGRWESLVRSALSRQLLKDTYGH